MIMKESRWKLKLEHDRIGYNTYEKSQGMKQLMAGGGVALIGMLLVPQLTGLFG